MKLKQLIKRRSYKNISYVVQFINSTRFMVSSLSNLVNNLSEGIHKIKYQYGHDYK